MKQTQQLFIHFIFEKSPKTNVFVGVVPKCQSEVEAKLDEARGFPNWRKYTQSRFKWSPICGSSYGYNWRYQFNSTPNGDR